MISRRRILLLVYPPVSSPSSRMKPYSPKYSMSEPDPNPISFLVQETTLLHRCLRPT